MRSAYEQTLVRSWPFLIIENTKGLSPLEAE
jgi:hypothetical protein